MVFELLSLIGLPLNVATAEGVRHGREKEKDDEEQQDYMRDFNIEVFCDSKSRKRDQVNATMVVLKDGKLYLTKRDGATGKPRDLKGDGKPSHPFTGFYMDFEPSYQPSNSIFNRLDQPSSIRGLVSTISDSPPTLNWIYVDRTTHELRYGNRLSADGHVLGPWHWTDDEEGLILEGWEGFVAVEEQKDLWAIYYDRDDNKLKNKVFEKRVLSCSLERKLVINDEDDQSCR